MSAITTTEAYPLTQQSTIGSGNQPTYRHKYPPTPHVHIGDIKHDPRLEHGVKEVKGVVANYKAFIDRGNVVDLAVGVVMGAAFSAIVQSLVNDIITPLVGIATGSQLQEAFIVLKPGHTGSKNFTTRDLAKADGAVTENYGNFLQQIVNFFIISIFVYIFVRSLNVMKFKQKKEKAVKDKKCDYCYKDIPALASRCCFCTSWLDEGIRAKAEGVGAVSPSYPGATQSSHDDGYSNVAYQGQRY